MVIKTGMRIKTAIKIIEKAEGGMTPMKIVTEIIKSATEIPVISMRVNLTTIAKERTIQNQEVIPLGHAEESMIKMRVVFNKIIMRTS